MSKFKAFLKNYDATLKAIFSEKGKTHSTLIFGYSSYFLNRFQVDLNQACKRRGIVIKRFEALKQFIEAMDFESGVDLFGEQSLQFVKVKTWTAAQSKELKKALDGWQGSLVLLVEKPIGAKALSSALTGLEFLELMDPWPSEVGDFIQWLCANMNLQLPRTLMTLFSETLGSDLGKLENELRQIALIDSATAAVSPSLFDKNYLQGLIEKNVFKVQDHLGQSKTAALHQHLAALLQQGESTHGILAVISRCYDAALASPRHGSYLKAAMTKTYANPLTQKKYDSIANAYTSSQLLGFYKKCQVADLELKGGQEQAFFLLRDILPQP